MKKLTLTALSSIVFTSTAFSAETPASYVSNDIISNVHNQCIVRLHDALDGQSITGLAKAFAAQNNTSIKHIYKHSINGFTINMPCHAASTAFGQSPYVVSMTPDSIMSINRGKPDKGGTSDVSPDPQVEPPGVAFVGGAVDGSGYNAWVIDTGIDLDHPDLNVDSGRGFSVIKSRGRFDMNDQNGHGTHVAGIIGAIDNDIGSLGVAPSTTVIPVRVLDRSGSGSTSGVIAGVDYVAENAAAGDCVNMSLGGGVNATLDNAVKAAAQSSGAYFVLAAGNEGDDASNHSPARANGPNIWTISAIDASSTMPSWSNWGSPVDFAAPGVNIFSLWKSGGTKTISGTSMAAPHACAIIMRTYGNPSSVGIAIGDSDDVPDPLIHY